MDRIGRKNTVRYMAIILASFLALCFVGGCDSGTEDESAEGERTPSADLGREYYADWLKHRSKYFEIRYAPNEDLHSRIQAIGEKMDEVILFNSMVLRTKPPDSLFVMLFENKTEGNRVTGKLLPFYSNDTIYYEVMSPIGLAISDYMLHKAAGDSIPYKFIEEGYPALLDFSGFNYHEMAQEYFDREEGYTAMQLVDNEIYSSMMRGPRRTLAASFIAFLTYTYGSAPIVGLLRQEGTAEDILQLATKKSIPELHADWERELPALAEIKSNEAQP